MKRRMAAAVALFACLAAQGGSLRAEDAPPDAGTLLFEEPQLAGTTPGETLDYAYSRKTADATQFGRSFDDHIRLFVEEGSGTDTRTIRTELFSGANRKPAGPFTDMTGNPLLSLVLEDNIKTLSETLSGNPRYFKNAVRAALRERASVVRDNVEVEGRTTPGWRVSIVPFKDDPNKVRMKGLDTLTYEFQVAKDVPGEIVAIHISAPGGANGPLFDEKVSYVGKSK